MRGSGVRKWMSLVFAGTLVLALVALLWLRGQPEPREVLMTAPISLANGVTSHVNFTVEREQQAMLKVAMLERFDYGEMRRILGNVADDQPGELKLAWRLTGSEGELIASSTSREYGYAPFISGQRLWGITIGKVMLQPGIDYQLALTTTRGEAAWDSAEPRLELAVSQRQLAKQSRTMQRYYMLVYVVLGASLMLLLMLWRSRKDALA